ncbi:Ig-like domain-containing protein [Neptunomonas phycophila]|uniref:Ig-like domain-containing protein n=1 Tax=Neptunomonas phycophila TaxID=1572645 RepID=UPI0026E40BAB|nr:Ig-like domain-containing protein [Neptunomonas phycophila]MDO6466800.1 Ig-like domain-containing protein [Neptunomonas phycophila]
MDFSLGFNLSQTNLLSAVPVPVNQQPTAYSDSATTAYQTPVEIDLITNDIDLDGSIDASSAEVTTHPVNGIVTINASNGVATYTPHDGFSGADSFEYRVSDTEGKWSEPVAVNLLVEPLQRYFTKLSSAAGMYFTFPEVPFGPGIDIELMMVSEPNPTKYATLISGGIGNNNAFNIDISTGESRFYVYNGTSAQLVLNRGYAGDGALHKYRIFSASGPAGPTRYYSDMNDVVDGGIVWDLGAAVRVGVLGARIEGSRYYNSYLSDVLIKQDGAVVAQYKIDEDFNNTTVLLDSSGNGNHGVAHNVTGSELFTLNKNTSPQQWENSDASVVIPVGYANYGY